VIIINDKEKSKKCKHEIDELDQISAVARGKPMRMYFCNHCHQVWIFPQGISDLEIARCLEEYG
jgi:uncharacterized protein YlaI